MNITRIEQSEHPVGGFIVYHDGPLSPYHIYDGMRESPLAIQLKGQADEFLKSNDLITPEMKAKELLEQIAASAKAEKQALSAKIDVINKELEGQGVKPISDASEIEIANRYLLSAKVRDFAER